MAAFQAVFASDFVQFANFILQVANKWGVLAI